MTCRYGEIGGIKTGTDSSGPGGVWRVPASWPDGVRHEGDVSLVCCFCTERGKAYPDTTALWGGDRERPKRAEPARG